MHTDGEEKEEEEEEEEEGHWESNRGNTDGRRRGREGEGPVKEME